MNSTTFNFIIVNIKVLRVDNFLFLFNHILIINKAVQYMWIISSQNTKVNICTKIAYEFVAFGSCNKNLLDDEFFFKKKAL